ncbi:MAG: thioredoxin domain-containing protein [Hyphomonadaceae bacterium]|jgi:protein-disulfide isomerase|nr:thioredoxin domain-containing protein [Caulobacteraceae bacterium]MBP6689215.1 thioredoxin domain-containing protein [Hyphomonadaceae bacterium]
MLVFGRRNLLLGGGALAALSVAGCNGSGGASGLSPDDMALGNPDSGVTLIEYGSTMCSHCREFEETVFRQIKTNYIDTNKIHFIFREVLAPVDPQRVIPTIALAEYQVARCNNATPEQYFSRLGVLFEQQPAMFQAGSRQGIEAKLIEIGGAAGLSADVVRACISDASGQDRMTRLGELATRDGVTGTPTFFLNGELMSPESIGNSTGGHDYAKFAALLDAAIAAHAAGG